MKQNSCLTYENFCLQLELDTLNYKFDKFKMEQMRAETNSRLKYIHHKSSESSTKKRTETVPPIHHHAMPEKLEIIRHDAPSCSNSHSVMTDKLDQDTIRPSCSKHTSNSHEKVVKIYERKQYPDVPEIKIINEKKIKEKRMKRSKDLHRKQSDCKEVKSKVSMNSKIEQNTRSEVSSETYYPQRRERTSSQKLALFQVSDGQSVVSSDFVSFPHLVRSRSFPDLQSKRDT